MLATVRLQQKAYEQQQEAFWRLIDDLEEWAQENNVTDYPLANKHKDDILIEYLDK